MAPAKTLLSAVDAALDVASRKASMELTASSFPDRFIWGAATAAYQIEGAVDEDGRLPSIWDTFSHTAGATHQGDTGDVATDHYHRFEEDVELMADLGLDAYRFSLSWSRILPEGTGEINPAGVAFYRRLSEALIDKGITPMATLYHWDLPQALQDRGGWANPESVGWFAQYAGAVKEALGDVVQTWATFNEPHCVAFDGHSVGRHAPGLADSGLAYVVAHNLMLAHHRAVGVMRETHPHDDDRFGIVLNLTPAWPNDPSDEAKAAARGVDAIHSRLFAAAVLDGRYPSLVLDYMARFGVDDQIDLEELADAVETIDYLGVNYYNINHIAHDARAEMSGHWPGVDGAVLAGPPGDLTDMGWGVEPSGLTWVLNRVTRWAPDVPLLIMENGAAYPDSVAEDGGVHDEQRIAYLREHIAAVWNARAEGANVWGYFVWSLLDNFEWSRGYSKRFGLIRVDYDTLHRIPKDSYHWYRGFLDG
jgi:beta-glucosidase